MTRATSPFSGSGPIVDDLGEIGLLQTIRSILGDVSPPSPQGIGDDCATFTPPPGEKLLLTTDPVVLGIHFTATDPAAKAGAKLLKRNLSDIASMGGKPGPALLAFAMGPDLQTDWLVAFVEGLATACREYGVPLVGGDITSASQGTFIANLTQTGTASRPVLRRGAKPASPIYVTGSLGGSLQGRHLDFIPRLQEGQFLATLGNLLSMTDLSDGLAKDLSGLLPPGTSASLDTSVIPLSADASSLDAAFCDGEDYELLFTLEPGTLLHDWPFPTQCTKIGEIIQSGEREPLLDSQTGNPLRFNKPGYAHFHS
jgi:thiamine-monophosphate kinase